MRGLWPFLLTGKNQDQKACLLVAYFRKESEELWVGVAGLKHFVESWEALQTKEKKNLGRYKKNSLMSISGERVGIIAVSDRNCFTSMEPLC